MLRAAHGAQAARARLVGEIEDTTITLLPEQSYVGTSLVVQPDAVLVSPGCHVLVEAKRIRGSTFQPEQLSREYLALTGDAGGRSPLLLLVIPNPPPVPVTGHGLLGVVEAVQLHLRSVHQRTGLQTPVEELEAAVPERGAWITWAEIRRVVVDQLSAMPTLDPSLQAPSIGSPDR